jgi:hypothetical protein
MPAEGRHLKMTTGSGQTGRCSAASTILASGQASTIRTTCNARQRTTASSRNTPGAGDRIALSGPGLGHERRARHQHRDPGCQGRDDQSCASALSLHVVVLEEGRLRIEKRSQFPLQAREYEVAR